MGLEDLIQVPFGEESGEQYNNVGDVIADFFIPFRGLVPGTEEREKDFVTEVEILDKARKFRTHHVARWDAFAAIQGMSIIIRLQTKAIDAWKETPGAAEKFEEMRKARIQAALSTTPTSELAKADDFFKGPTPFQTVGDIVAKIFTPFLGVVAGTEERLQIVTEVAKFADDIPPTTASEDEKNAFMATATKALQRMQQACLDQVDAIKTNPRDVITSIMEAADAVLNPKQSE